MSLAHINYTTKEHLGFFLTSGPKTEFTKDEHAVVTRGVDVAIKRLKEYKIRGANILNNLPQIKDIADEVAKTLETSGNELNCADCLENWTTYAHMIVFASIASYHAKAQKYADKKNN